MFVSKSCDTFLSENNRCHHSRLFWEEIGCDF